MTKTIEKNIHQMKLHEITELNTEISILRVPWGWIYMTYFEDGVTSTFVPFHNEFMYE